MSLLTRAYQFVRIFQQDVDRPDDIIDGLIRTNAAKLIPGMEKDDQVKREKATLAYHRRVIATLSEPATEVAETEKVRVMGRKRG